MRVRALNTLNPQTNHKAQTFALLFSRQVTLSVYKMTKSHYRIGWILVVSSRKPQNANQYRTYKKERWLWTLNNSGSSSILKKPHRKYSLKNIR